MASIQAVSDVKNAFLSRREIVCDFEGAAGSLTRPEAVRMVEEKFDASGKTVVAIRLKNHVGKTLTTGTFYVYEDEALAKKHVNPAIFARLDKAKAAADKAAQEAADKAKEESEAAPADKPEGDAKDAPKDGGAKEDAQAKAEGDAKPPEPAEDAPPKEEAPAKPEGDAKDAPAKEAES